MDKEADDLWEKGNQVSQLFRVIEKAKKKAVGYDEGDTSLFKKVCLVSRVKLCVEGSDGSSEVETLL